MSRYYTAGSRVMFDASPRSRPVEVAVAETESWAKGIAHALNRNDYYNKQDPY